MFTIVIELFKFLNETVAVEKISHFDCTNSASKLTDSAKELLLGVTTRNPRDSFSSANASIIRFLGLEKFFRARSDYYSRLMRPI